MKQEYDPQEALEEMTEIEEAFNNNYRCHLTPLTPEAIKILVAEYLDARRAAIRLGAELPKSQREIKILELNGI